jgi:hypothetical protein
MSICSHQVGSLGGGCTPSGHLHRTAYRIYAAKLMIFGTNGAAPAAVSGRFGSVDGSHAGVVPSI